MSHPFMQLYVADYLGDTRHLTTEQHGAYLLILMTMWRAGGYLPNDDAKLARIAGLSVAKWRKLSPDILAMLTVDGDQITQARLLKEIENANEKSSKRSEAGKLGVAAKSLKNNNVPQANAEPLLKHSSEPEPEQDILDTEVSNIKATQAPAQSPKPPKPPPNRGTRLPPDWEPTDDDWQFAQGRGLTPKEIDDEALKFRNYWCARVGGATKLSWSRTWQNWIIQSCERPRRNGPGLASGPAFAGGSRQGVTDFAEIVARRRLQDRDLEAVSG